MALTGATLGKTAIVKSELGLVYQNYRVGNFIPRSENELSKNYLYYLLSSKVVQKQIFEVVNTQASKVRLSRLYLE